MKSDQPPSPRLGIFWIVTRRRIVSYSMPLNRAEHAAGFANYPHGHAQLWPLVVRSHPRLRGKTYDQVPRGRVTYERAGDTFRLLLPQALADDEAVVERLVRRFRLPPGRSRVLADGHYDPPPNEVGVDPSRGYNREMLTKEPDFGTFLITAPDDNPRNWEAEFETAWLGAEAKARGQSVDAAFDAIHHNLNSLSAHGATRWIDDTLTRQPDDTEPAMLVHLTTVARSATDRELRDAAARTRASAILILKRGGGTGDWYVRWLTP